MRTQCIECDMPARYRDVEYPEDVYCGDHAAEIACDGSPIERI